MSNTIEIWKDIEGYEGIYQVSNLGRVKSLYHGKERILKGCGHPEGYVIIHLSKDGKKTGFSLHRLVANAFIPNPLNLPQINHIDEDKSNNCVDNLEWCTAKYNMNHGTRIQRSADSARGKRKKVYQFALDGTFIREWDSQVKASRAVGVSNTSISQCISGIYKTAGGYIWRNTPVFE